MTDLVSTEARELVAASLGDDRVLITGSSGWLGRTAVDLIAPLGLPILALAGRASMIEVPSRTLHCRVWEKREVAAFAPTIVLDCAFLTKGWAAKMPLAEYITINRTLTDQLVWAARLPGVRLAVTVSSGAALFPQDALNRPIHDNPYGYLKREAEHRLMDATAGSDAVPVIARAWSISGAHVRNPRDFALGSMIQDAHAGAIQILANHPVFRRYTLAEELLAVAIAEGQVGPATIDSGGELVEMAELAARITKIVRPDAVVTRDAIDLRSADHYHSDGEDWEMRCRRWNLATASLERQITISARGVLSARAS